jgi:glycosyltransferase involved in cell wall biosynthesis
MDNTQVIKGLVTCCIPSYNHQHYVKDAILSVINQDYNDVELIVIDDGSSDQSKEVIQKLEAKCRDRFVYTKFIYRENQGLSITLNEMLSFSRGEYVTFLASDDQFLPHKITSLVTKLSSLDNNVYCSVFGDAAIFSELNDNATDSFVNKYTKSGKINADVNYIDILTNNYLPAMSALYTRKSLVAIGGFTTNLRLEDWDLYLRLLQCYKIYYTQNVVAKYRLHDFNSIFIENTRLLKDTLKILHAQKEYAFANGGKDVWYWKLYDTYYTLLRKRELSLCDCKEISLYKVLRYLLLKISSRFFNR